MPPSLLLFSTLDVAMSSGPVKEPAGLVVGPVLAEPAMPFEVSDPALKRAWAAADGQSVFETPVECCSNPTPSCLCGGLVLFYLVHQHSDL